MNNHQSYADAVFNQANFDPDRAALIYQLNPVDAKKRSEVTLTYGALAGNSARLASFLGSNGLKKGDCALVGIPLGAELYEILFALNRLGMVAVFLDAWSSPESIARTCRRIKPKAFFGIPKAHRLRWVIKPLASIALQIIVSPQGMGPKFSPGGHHYHQIIQSTEAGEVMTPLNATDPQLIVFTTGSAGRPKGCIRDQRLALSSIKALNDGILFRAEGSVEMVPWPGMILASFYHLRTVVVPAFEQGNIRRCDYRHSLNLLDKHGVSAIIAPPVFFQNLIHAAGDEHRPALNRIKLALTGGAAVTESMLGQMQTHFPCATAAAVYGCTEAEPIATISADGYRRLNVRGASNTGLCAGSVHHSLECRIVKDTAAQLAEKDLIDNQCPQHEVGEIVVRGPQVSRGYFNDHHADSRNKIIASSGENWHRTGDFGYFDEHNTLWITGRRHSVVRTASGTFYPHPVESTFKRIPGVASAGLAGGADPGSGRPLAVVVLDVSGARDGWKIISRAEKLNRDSGIFVDRILLCRNLPLDPRHNTKIDYPVLSRAVRKHLAKKAAAPFVQIRKAGRISSFFKQLCLCLAMFYRTRCRT